MTGEELRVKRVLARLTLAEVAEMAGMSASRLCNYENGVHKPNEESLKRVADAIGRLSKFGRTIHDGGNRLLLKPKGNTGRVKVYRMPPLLRQ